ncbi:hypothetical protein C4K39_2404 [Pseudomonas sessilinigenes]|nr:hypothetical protein C4K39_2404 [Pseudomonas sessilinigenes]
MAGSGRCGADGRSRHRACQCPGSPVRLANLIAPAGIGVKRQKVVIN